jgi:hypothetical protein
MNNTNIEKAKQLGMPFGTAAAKLRKSLLFSAIKKLGEDTCFKCGIKIESINDFSIEHKKPWLYVSSDLFWDLDNIAYSHIKCNRPDRNNSEKIRLPEDKAHGRYGVWKSRKCRCPLCKQAKVEYQRSYRERTGIH